MNPTAAYAVGTLLVWIGSIALLRAIYALLLQQRALGALIGGGVSLVVGSLLLPAGQLKIPLIWPVMPFMLWVAAACWIVALTKIASAVLDPKSKIQTEKLRSAAISTAIGLVAWILYRATPDTTVSLLRGGIPLSVPEAVGLVALAVAALLAMVLTNRSVGSRGSLAKISTHVALIVGSLIFGAPLFWLILTSFKEERDMASPNGLVFVPRVSATVAYRNPDNPLYEGMFEGVKVEAKAITTKGDMVKLHIEKPRGMFDQSFEARKQDLKQIPEQVPLVTGKWDGQTFQGLVMDELDDGSEKVQATTPASLAGKQRTFAAGQLEPVRKIGLRWENYVEALDFLPPVANHGLTYLKNTLILVILSVLGTLLSSAIVAYSFARLRYPGKNAIFAVVLSTMMLPSAVTLLPQFLIFRSLGWIDTLLPLWVPAFFGSAFNIFLLRQFFLNIPMELEDAAKIDGCGYLKSFWSVMLPQVKPALAVIAIWTFLGAWNNFMGPLIYINSPEHMPISYAVQMYSSDRSGEPALLMAFTTMAILPVLLLFFFAQRYFVEGVTLSGLGGR